MMSVAAQKIRRRDRIASNADLTAINGSIGTNQLLTVWVGGRTPAVVVDQDHCRHERGDTEAEQPGGVVDQAGGDRGHEGGGEEADPGPPALAAGEDAGTRVAAHPSSFRAVRPTGDSIDRLISPQRLTRFPAGIARFLGRSRPGAGSQGSPRRSRPCPQDRRAPLWRFARFPEAFAGPAQDRGPPRADHGPPRADHGLPRGIRGPRADHGPPRADHGFPVADRGPALTAGFPRGIAGRRRSGSPVSC